MLLTTSGSGLFPRQAAPPTPAPRPVQGPTVVPVRLKPRPEARRPPPPPLATDDRGAVLAGIAVWLVSLVVLMLSRSSLVADGRGWWIWTAVAGIGLGVIGLGHLHRRARRDPGNRRATPSSPREARRG